MQLGTRKLHVLQRLIDRAARAHSEAFRTASALNEWCERHYGFAPSDVDADEIIDRVLGGGGEANGMRAERFDDVMSEINRRQKP